MAEPSVDLIQLLIIVEITGIIIATIVIILEMFIHRSTIKILKKMNEFSKKMDSNLEKQISKIDGHTKKLEEHVDDLDKHSHRMEDTMGKILKENEEIYKRVCYPFENDAGKG